MLETIGAIFLQH